MSGVQGILREIAGDILRKAWVDYYNGFYDWALEKAYRAIYTLLQPSMHDTPLPLLSLKKGCPRDITLRLQHVEYSRTLAFNPLLRIIYGQEETSPGKQEALQAIEAAILVKEAANTCRRAPNPLPAIISKLSKYSGGSNSSILLEGYTVYIISPEFTGVRVKDRLKLVEDRVPLGLRMILLTPDELLALLEAPGEPGRMAGVEVLADNVGISMVLEAYNR